MLQAVSHQPLDCKADAPATATEQTLLALLQRCERYRLLSTVPQMRQLQRLKLQELHKSTSAGSMRKPCLAVEQQASVACALLSNATCLTGLTGLHIGQTILDHDSGAQLTTALRGLQSLKVC